MGRNKETMRTDGWVGISKRTWLLCSLCAHGMGGLVGERWADERDETRAKPWSATPSALSLLDSVDVFFPLLLLACSTGRCGKA